MADKPKRYKKGQIAVRRAPKAKRQPLKPPTKTLADFYSKPAKATAPARKAPARKAPARKAPARKASPSTGKRLRDPCWTRTGRSGTYVVCSGSKGQKGVYKPKRK